MRYDIIIDKRTGNSIVEGMEQSVECGKLVEVANTLGHVVNASSKDHDDDNPVHQGTFINEN